MIKDQLTSKIAGIILHFAREEKGRLTTVSDMCRINRKEFNVRGLSLMKLHRLLRVIYALRLVLPCREYEQMVKELSACLDDFCEEYDYTLLDEQP